MVQAERRFTARAIWRRGVARVMLCALLGSTTEIVAAPPAADPGEFFESQVRPLLVETCFKCHSDKKAESSLRVDSRAALMQGGDNGPAINPGNPKQSLLIQVVSHQSDIEMPPDSELTGDQVAVLEKWIEAGAPWPGEVAAARKTRSGEPTDEERKFWSFQPITDPPVPTSSGQQSAAGSQSEHPIDAFIGAKLAAKGISQVAPAGKHALLRRVTFDLTGLPPTPGEIEAFVADASPDALAKVVERLLASSAYGERWGRHWLDVVRYADTAGETADYPVPEAWKYRNYVIKSFNDDKPYDEFIREQIAGDLLAAEGPPEKYAERVTATGFLAISRRFGFDSINYQHLTIADTLDTVGQSVMGLSLGCARCHDHKYDPVTAADYYALYGVFASTKYAFPGDEQTKRPRDFPAAIPATSAAESQKKYDADLAAIENQTKQAEADRTTAIAEFESLVDMDGGFELQPAEKAPSMPWRQIDHVVTLADAQSPFTNVRPRGSQGARFANDQANNAIGQAIIPPRTAKDTPKLFFNVDFRSTKIQNGGDGSYRFYLGHGPGPSAAVEFFANGNAFFVRNGDQIEKLRDLELGKWYNVQLELNLEARTYRGAIGVPGDLTLFEGKAFFPKWDGTIDDFFVDGYGHIGGVKPEHDVDNVTIRTAAIPAVQETLPATTGGGDNQSLAQKIADTKEKLASLDQKIESLKKQQADLVERGAFEQVYAVAEGDPHNEKIQKRGEPLKLGDEVPRRFLTVLGGDVLPTDEKGSGRRQLAQWLTRPENPLTARVIVNRVWQHHFGEGLVASENNFGVRGKLPTHPELLDYLAKRLMENGWSLKWLHRFIFQSRVYQLSSSFNAACAAVDPANELLWRFNRRRIDAEELRDALLTLGGQLDRSPGEAHPFPPVATWGFTQHAPFAAVYESNRRSVYLMTQRLKRHPFLTLFDGADTNASTAERAPTTVPTQALFIMNDPLVHAQSAGFAKQLIATSSDAAERVRLAYRMALGREASQEELRLGIDFVDRVRARHEQLGLPADVREEYVWSAFGRTLFSSNEFVFVD